MQFKQNDTGKSFSAEPGPRLRAALSALSWVPGSFFRGKLDGDRIELVSEAEQEAPHFIFERGGLNEWKLYRLSLRREPKEGESACSCGFVAGHVGAHQPRVAVPHRTGPPRSHRPEDAEPSPLTSATDVDTLSG